MSYRRRHRWFPRLALALAVVSVMFVGRASVAAAKVDEGTSAAQQIQVIPYLSHGILTQADADVAAAAAQPQKPRPNPYMSLWMARDYSAWQTRRPGCGRTRSRRRPVLPLATSRRRSSRPTGTTGGSSGRTRCRSASASSCSGSLSGWRSAFCAGRGSQASRHRAGTPEAGSSEPAFACGRAYGTVTPLSVTGLWIV